MALIFITTGYSGFIPTNLGNVTNPPISNARGLRIVNELRNVPIVANKTGYTFDNNERNTPSYTPFIGKDFRSGLLDILKDNNDKIETTILSNFSKITHLKI